MLAIIKKWADDSRLPQSERDDFRNEEYRDRIIKHMTKLAQVTAPGAWTVEADMWALYNQGDYAPNGQLALLLCSIVDGLISKIEWWSQQDSTFLQRFKEATSKRVLVLFPNSSVDKHCESEYKDGKLIYHIKNVCNIDYEWGGDLLTLLESAAQQKGVKLSKKLGESLMLDMRIGEGDKPFAAIRKLIELDVVDMPMTTDYNYPLFVLVYNWKHKLADMLMPHVKNPNVRDADGETPLITAAKGPNETSWRLDSRERQAQTKMIEVLLKHPQTDVNATDKHGRTALMYVAQTYGWDEAAELLINDPRTDINFENRKMETALDFAVSIKWDWVIKVLRKHREQGTKPSVKITQVTPVPSTPSAPTFATIPKAPVKVAYNGSVSSPQPQSTSTSPSTPPPPPPPMMPKATVPTTSVVSKSNFGAKVSTFGAAPKKSPQFGSSNGFNTITTVSTTTNNGNPPPPPPPMALKATATSTSNTFALPKLSPVKNPVQRAVFASPQANNKSNELPPLPPPMARKSSSIRPEQKFSELAKEFYKIVDAYRTFELQVTLASLEDDPLNKILSLNTQLGQTVDQAEKMFNTLNPK